MIYTEKKLSSNYAKRQETKKNSIQNYWSYMNM